MKDQLDVTCYFISLIMCSTCFGTLMYPSSGACDCVVELPHRSSCSQFVVCWRFGAAGAPRDSALLLSSKMPDVLLADEPFAGPVGLPYAAVSIANFKPNMDAAQNHARQ